MPHQTQPPTVYPLHIDAVKKQLNIDHNLDDDLLQGYIAAALRWVEDYTGSAIVQQSYAATFRYFGDRHSDSELYKHSRALKLTPLPLLVIDSIRYLDTSGVENTLSEYRLNSWEGKISPAIGQCFPATLCIDDAINVSYQAGLLIPFTANATDDTLSVSGLSMANNTLIVLSSNHTLPGGLSDKARYYVINSTGATFQVSLTQGGAAVAISSAGTGEHFIGIVSPSLLHAMHLLIGHWYQNREDSIIGVVSNAIQKGVDSLIAPYRNLSL